MGHMIAPLLLIVLLVLFFPATAHAYIDPGTGALIWQAILVISVGLLFHFRRLLARFIEVVRFWHRK